MLHKIPVAGLFRLTWIFSFISSLLVGLFLLAVKRGQEEAVLRSIETFVFISLCCLLNIFLFSLKEKFYKRSRTFFLFCFYVLSYLGVLLTWLLVKTVYSVVTGQPWEGTGVNEMNAYLLAVLSIWSFNTLILVVQNLVIFQHSKSLTEIENLQLRASVADTTNLLLKQQLHPHFLKLLSYV